MATEAFQSESIGLRYIVDMLALTQSLGRAKMAINNFHTQIKTGSATATKALEDIGKGAEKASAGISKAKKAAFDATQELKRMGVTNATTTAEFKKLNLSTLEYKRVVDLTKKQMKDLETATRGNSAASKKASETYDRLSKRVSHASFMVRKQSEAMGDSQRAMERWSASGMKAMALSQLAWLTMGAAIFGTMAGISRALRDIGQLHQDLKNLEAITQSTAGEMRMMEMSIRDAAVGTKFFAADMTQAATVMAQAGFNAREVSDAVGAVAVLASATGRDLTEVADLMTSIIRAYNLNASEALRVANVLAAGISESKLQVDTLTTAMNYMGVAAHQFGISLEDTVGWLGVLRDRGMKASTIGTSFRGVLATLVKETDKFSAVLAKLPEPLAFSDITIRNGRKIEDAMQRLADSGFDVVNAFEALPRRTAMTFSLMVKNVEAFKDLREEVTGTNRAIEMNEIAMQGLQSQMAQTKSIFDDFVASLTRSGGTLEPIVAALKALVQTIAAAIMTIVAGMNMAVQGLAALAAVGTTAVEGPKFNREELRKIREEQGLIAWLRAIPEKGFTGAKIKDSELRGIVEGLEESLAKTWDQYVQDVGRIMGSGYFTNKPYLGGKARDAAEKEKETEEDINALYEKRLQLVDQLRAMSEDDSEYRKIHGQVLTINALLKEMGADDTKGPMSTLQSVLGRGVFGPGLTFEKLKGTTPTVENIGKIRAAIVTLRKEVGAAIQDYVETLGEEEEQRVRDAFDNLNKAKAKLATLEKSIERDKNKQAADARKAERDRAKAQREEEKRLRELEKLERARIRYGQRIDRGYARAADLRDRASKRIKKIELDEYEYQKMLIKQQAEDMRRSLDEQIAAHEATYKEIELLAMKHPGFLAHLIRVRQLIDTLRSQYPGIDEMEEAELGEVGGRTEVGKGLMRGFRDTFRTMSDEFKLWKDLAATTAEGMRSAFSDVFFDAMKNELKSFNDYWEAFTLAIRRQIANIAAEWAMSGIFGTGGGKGGNWGLVGKAASAVWGWLGGTAHLGGLQKFHTGGRNSNEGTRVLRSGEYVIRDSSVRSIGTSMLDFMNRTGRVPATAPAVTNHYHTSVVAMDAQSFDMYLRNAGARAIRDISLGSVAMGRKQRDRRVV